MSFAKKLLLLAVLLIIVVGGIFIYFSFTGDGWSEGRAEEILETTETIEAYIEQQSAAGWTVQSSALIAEQVTLLPGVEYADSGEGFLLVKYIHGGEQLWLLDPIAGESFGAGSAGEAVFSPTISGLDISALPSSAAPLLQNQKAIILNALADDPSYAPFNLDLDNLEMLLGELGFLVERYCADEADLEKYKKLDQYDLVLVIGHGKAGNSRGRDWVKVQTGERAPLIRGEYELLREYWSDWRNGYISMVLIYWNPDRDLPEWRKITAYRRYWAINDRFFHRYATSFQDALFVNWACSGLKNKAMAEALVKAGAGAYLGWTDEFGISPLPVYCILLHLAEGETLVKAIDSLPGDWKKDYRFGAANLTFYPQAAGSLKLEAAYKEELIARLYPYCREETRGNTVGNIANYGLAAKQGDWIYYLEIEDDEPTGIYKVRTDGSGRTRLSDVPAIFINVVGDWIYAVGIEDDGPAGEIFKIRTDGSGRTRLSDGPAGFINVLGDWIYYIGYDKDDDPGAIYKIRTDGSGRTRLSDDPAMSINVVGDWIYYVKFDESDGIMSIYKIRTDGAIYKIRTDGSSRTRLSDDPAMFINVVGDWIYYIGIEIDDTVAIYKVRTDGSSRTRLSDDPAMSINVVGDWIYYIGIEIDDTVAIYKIRTDGSGRQLVNSSDDSTHDPDEIYLESTSVEGARVQMGLQINDNSTIRSTKTSFEAGEAFYISFDNNAPFGSGMVTMRVEESQSREIVGEVDYEVDPEWTIMVTDGSLNEPGKYKFSFIIGGQLRASQEIIIK